ncbi:hypothetical protein A0256_13470 [Mucilaginibacter sp. PAMC 26640]|nr:hypothetical protein A0256_13470 [Mucilaginibacter sp. PAMC 26640]
MKQLFVLLLTLASFSNIYGQSISLPKNTEFEYDSHEQLNFPYMNNNYRSTFQFKVLGKEGNNTLLECRLVRVWVNNKQNDQQYHFNTDSLENTTFNSTNSFLHLALLQKPLVVKLDSSNTVIDILGVMEAIDEAAKNWGLSRETTSMLKNNAQFYPENELNNLFFKLPKQKITYGMEWQAADSVFYNVTAITAPRLYIRASDKPNDSQIMDNATKIVTFNEVTGLIEQSYSKSKQQSEVLTNGHKITTPQYQLEVTVRMGASKHAIDTAWINMAVKTSAFWSDAFKTGTVTDSAKVLPYFRAHDGAFRGDATYTVNKLSLVQQVTGVNDFKTYEALLIKTPTRYLKDQQSHLFNKMGNMLHLSVDSAEEISHYMYKDAGFKGWVQESFAQNFISMDYDELVNDEEFKKYVKEKAMTPDSVKKWFAEQTASHNKAELISKQLLNRLHVDKDPIMRQQTEPLYLWVDAKEHKKDGDYLIKTGKKLIQLDDVYQQRGNGSRYALLIYKMLVSVKKQPEADVLLKKTMANLERFAADTLSRSRNADQNILAYAWYLKYTDAKLADSVKALQYLAKAAQSSPKNEKEKAYTSFYDRVFLKSKESYRDEFITRLFNSGNDEEALKVFVENINAEPGTMDQMQKVYESHFPGKDYKAFFKNNIVSSWQPAPAFTLRGIDGTDRSLSDFKGKWLVLDFWGTWCSPCREEMPALNTYSQEIKAGQHAGINLLSIACRDLEVNVKSYLKNNRYDLPAVMSNRVIENDYAITGYPTKVIISPNGKMLSLKYGEDWAALVEKFNGLSRTE